MLQSFIVRALETMAAIVIQAVVVAILIGVAIAIYDRVQTQDTVRRNYPLIGRFRALSSSLAQFFRQYFFTVLVTYDRETRSISTMIVNYNAELDQAAKNLSGVVAATPPPPLK